MIEIRYSVLDNIYPLSALEGNPTMNDNCYYVADKSATFFDRRPSSILENAGLAAWKIHITGDSGSIEANPNFDANYMPTNAQCAGMGIQYPLIINDPINGIENSAPLPETFAYIDNGILYIETPIAETVQVYSIIGALLANIQKPEGKVSYSIKQLSGAIIILRGTTGWVKKIFVQ
jgi:hypothetical protein